MESFLSLISTFGRSGSKRENTTLPISPPSTEGFAFSFFLTPCESDAKRYGCDIFHSRTRVICCGVSTALAYTFALPLSLKQNGVFTYHTTSGGALTPHHPTGSAARLCTLEHVPMISQTVPSARCLVRSRGGIKGKPGRLPLPSRGSFDAIDLYSRISGVASVPAPLRGLAPAGRVQGYVRQKRRGRLLPKVEATQRSHFPLISRTLRVYRR